MLDSVFKSLRQGGRDSLQFTPVEVRLVMDQAYDKKYNIHKDIDFKPREMPGVAYYWTEDEYHFSGLSEKLRIFLNYEIGKHLNISYEVFSNYPSVYQEMVITEVKSFIDRKAIDQDNILNNAGQHSASPTNNFPTS
jgi:hypothetical protein